MLQRNLLFFFRAISGVVCVAGADVAEVVLLGATDADGTFQSQATCIQEGDGDDDDDDDDGEAMKGTSAGHSIGRFVQIDSIRKAAFGLQAPAYQVANLSNNSGSGNDVFAGHHECT